MQAEEFDVLIVGGGMVGSMLAAALAFPAGKDPDLPGRALRVAVLEAEDPEPWPVTRAAPESHDLRVSALSPASQAMLERVGVWAGVVQRRACPYRRMRVWDGNGQGDVCFDARELALPALGHIVENRVLQLALHEGLDRLPASSLLKPARMERFDCRQNRVEVLIQHQGQSRRLKTRLLVGADGARSAVRAGAGIAWHAVPYEQHALVATVATALPQQDITWQRFVAGGPQAFLPLTGQQASLVWYDTPEATIQRAALPREQLAEAFEASFPEELGAIESVLAQGHFPLVRAHAAQYVAPHIALIGDAAHTVHPLAGQGVNLGLLDAASLAGHLRAAVAAGAEADDARALSRYARERREENRVAISALDQIQNVFDRNDPLRRVLRTTALTATRHIGPVRQQLVREAVGQSGQVPPLARPSLCHRMLQNV